MPLKITKPLFFIFIFIQQTLCAQSGGRHVFEFLQITGHARTASLGGNAICTNDDDLSLIYQNPALLTNEMSQHVVLSFVSFPGNITLGDMAYAHSFKSTGDWAIQVHYIDYKTLDRTDENSNVIGQFKSQETALMVSWSKLLFPDLRIGTTVKGIFSSLGDVSSNGIAADAALNWYDSVKKWSVSVVMKNAGAQIKRYTPENNEPLPFEIQAGVSKQLLKAPFRFSMIAQQLQKPDLSYADPFRNTVDALTGDKKEQNDRFFEKSIRHLIFNTEILFSKNFHVRFGYNFLRRNELSLLDKKGMSGISLGFGFKIKSVGFSYAYAQYLPYAGSNHFTISTTIAGRKSASKEQFN